MSQISPEALARRRILGAVLLLMGVSLAAIVIWREGNTSPAKPDKPRVRLVSIPPLGLAFAHPATWTRTIVKRIVRLRSPEGSTVLTIASPIAGRHPAEVKSALINDLRTTLTDTRIVRQGPASVGVVKVSSFELTGRTAGRLVRVLGLVSSTQYRTYAITLVTSARPSARRLAEARGILQTVRFGQPVDLNPVAPAPATTTSP